MRHVRKAQFYQQIPVQLCSVYITPLTWTCLVLRGQYLPRGTVLRPRNDVCKEPSARHAAGVPYLHMYIYIQLLF